MPVSHAAQVIIDLIAERDYVTFAEITQRLDGLITPVEGDQALELGAFPNVVLWAGMSDAYIAVMHEVLQSHLSTMEPASVLAYMVDGACLSLPIVKRPQKQGYATPHWLPVCFRPKTAPARTRKRRQETS